MLVAETPLSSTELRDLERALRGVHRELRALLGLVPVEAQTASGLARHLKTERTTCQRAVSAANQPFSGVALAAQLPGSQGLRLLAETAVRLHSEQTIVETAGRLRSAVATYEQVVRRVAGSRTRLLKRLQSERADAVAIQRTAESDDETWRRSLFEAAAVLTGRSSETWLAVHIYEPASGSDRLQQTRAHGLVGHRATERAVPLTFHVFTTNDPEDNQDGQGGGQGDPDAMEPFRPLEPATSAERPAEILERFSTQPSPIVRSRQPNEFLVQFVEPSPDQPAAAPFDLMFGMTGGMIHPAMTSSRFEEVWALVNFPVRRLLLDVFLHRDLARRCLPGLDVHLWRPDFASQAGERWQTRFPQSPRLQMLGSDLSQARSPAYGRHTELLNYLFTRRGLDPRDYVGYRCEESYPIWRTGYRMSFDYGG